MITWLASFPRSGNTFFRVLLHASGVEGSYTIHDETRDIGASPEFSGVVGSLGQVDQDDLQELRKRRSQYFVKSHFSPQNWVRPGDRVVLLHRDPREAVPSYADFLKHFSDRPLSVREIACGETQFGSWSNFYWSWLNLAAVDRTVISFDSLITTPLEVLSQTGLLVKEQEAPSPKKQIPSFEDLKAISGEFFAQGKTRDASLVSGFERSLIEAFNWPAMKVLGYKLTPELHTGAIDYLHIRLSGGARQPEKGPESQPSGTLLGRRELASRARRGVEQLAKKISRKVRGR